MGQPTLELATAYHEYLQGRGSDRLVGARLRRVSNADERAARQTAPRALVERIVHNLEKLLGSAEIVTRIREWQDAYAEALVRCEFGKGLDDEMDTAITGGIRARQSLGRSGTTFASSPGRPKRWRSCSGGANPRATCSPSRRSIRRRPTSTPTRQRTTYGNAWRLSSTPCAEPARIRSSDPWKPRSPRTTATPSSATSGR